MPLFYCAIALASVTVIYLFWRSYEGMLLQRRRVLRERVAHMLWVMADLDGTETTNRGDEVDSPADVA